jgi:hypothetical protein
MTFAGAIGLKPYGVGDLVVGRWSLVPRYRALPCNALLEALPPGPNPVLKVRIGRIMACAMTGGITTEVVTTNIGKRTTASRYYEHRDGNDSKALLRTGMRFWMLTKKKITDGVGLHRFKFRLN